MRFIINREALLKPLQLISGVVERRQTIPILSNILMNCDQDHLILLGTNIDVELSSYINLEKPCDSGMTTASARKLIDICRSLPEGIDLEFQQQNHQLIVRSGLSRFNLATLSAVDFPINGKLSDEQTFSITQKKFHKLLVGTSFAMAEQDVRYYLNGMLLELKNESFKSVATDGHRLALSTVLTQTPGDIKIILPRKAVFELSKLLSDGGDDCIISINSNKISIKIDNYTLISKLISGQFPDYGRVIPNRMTKVVYLERDLLKQSLIRAAILTNDRHKSVQFNLEQNLLCIITNNSEQEEAEEQIEVNYSDEPVSIVFNIQYLIDVINSLDSGLVKISLTDSDSSVRFENTETYPELSALYVIMPMRL